MINGARWLVKFIEIAKKAGKLSGGNVFGAFGRELAVYTARGCVNFDRVVKVWSKSSITCDGVAGANL